MQILKTLGKTIILLSALALAVAPVFAQDTGTVRIETAGHPNGDGFCTISLYSPTELHSFYAGSRDDLDKTFTLPSGLWYIDTIYNTKSFLVKKGTNQIVSLLSGDYSVYDRTLNKKDIQQNPLDWSGYSDGESLAEAEPSWLKVYTKNQRDYDIQAVQQMPEFSGRTVFIRQEVGDHPADMLLLHLECEYDVVRTIQSSVGANKMTSFSLAGYTCKTDEGETWVNSTIDMQKFGHFLKRIDYQCGGSFYVGKIMNDPDDNKSWTQYNTYAIFSVSTTEFQNVITAVRNGDTETGIDAGAYRNSTDEYVETTLYSYKGYPVPARIYSVNNKAASDSFAEYLNKQEVYNLNGHEKAFYYVKSQCPKDTYCVFVFIVGEGLNQDCWYCYNFERNTITFFFNHGETEGVKL
jgi:hypothetical protein